MEDQGDLRLHRPTRSPKKKERCYSAQPAFCFSTLAMNTVEQFYLAEMLNGCRGQDSVVWALLSFWRKRHRGLVQLHFCVFVSSRHSLIFSFISLKTSIMNYRLLMMLIAALAILSCNNSTDTKMAASKYKTIGTIDRIDPALDSIMSPGVKIEVIADSFDWSEGPVWIESKSMLLFSDVPQNIVYKWTEEKGKEVFLTPSGY